jgi:hypothetical protein
LTVPLPGRPEEFHLQPPTEPYVKFSLHTARDGLTPDGISAAGRRERLCSSGFPRWQSRSLSHLIPFAPDPLQIAQCYCGMIRPLHVHRYFPPSWFALMGFSLRIT